MVTARTDQDLIYELDAVHAQICVRQLHLFDLLLEAERRALWRDQGARDLPHFVSIRYGISWWKANRWLRAAHALQDLPRLSEAFASGRLGVDKVVELARFATASDEAALIGWAQGVSVAAIRRKGDLQARRSLEEAQQADRSRFLAWWHTDEGRRIGLEAELPAAEGAAVIKAIRRVSERIPAMPEEEGGAYASARRADALVAICRASLASDPDADRATIVIHAPIGALAADAQGSQIEGGGVVHPQTVRRLACTSRVQVVAEDANRNPLGLGRLSRVPSDQLMRLLRHRDGECRFPGCGSRAFTQAHHIRWWSRGGRTDLDNLILCCTFHHKLVHEYGWSIVRARDGTVRWFRPDGIRYRARPKAPDLETVEPRGTLVAPG